MKDNKQVDKNSQNQTCYMPICMCLGMSLGTAIGVAADNLPVCMSLGIGFDLCIGSAIDARNGSENKNSESAQMKKRSNNLTKDYSGVIIRSVFGERSEFHAAPYHFCLCSCILLCSLCPCPVIVGYSVYATAQAKVCAVFIFKSNKEVIA